ncbi:MAG: DNA methyltransferase, partial [Euryarchaeota archaeon]|nr:DNA methyltransferase [Euryarchaeota archaeon]
IQLYMCEGEVVLDPFMGHGQTAIAAIKANRRYIGYATDHEYAKLADNRDRVSIEIQLSEAL